MPKLSELEKVESRERVLDGARRCFATYGYEGATVVRLEQEIGMSRGAIFNWFPSKEELFIALAARDNERLLHLFAEEGLEAILDALLRDDPDWLAVYLEFGRRMRADSDLRLRWQSIAPESARERSRAWIEEGQASGSFRRDVDARLAAWIVYGGLEEVLTGWVLGQLPDAERNVADAERTAIGVALRGLTV